jgi:dephospho-CoA kinase
MLPYKLGITGGIGSGKTSVCRVFSVLGVPVFSADPVASEIMENDPEIRKKLNSIAGMDLFSNGIMKRKELADLIFNDATLLAKVNSLIHPVVFGNFLKWAESQQYPYVIIEAAILFESGGSKFTDKIATVVAPLQERIERVMLRNSLTREQVNDRIRNQMSDEERIMSSHYVIRNAENDMIIPQVLQIHNDLLTLIKNKN